MKSYKYDKELRNLNNKVFLTKEEQSSILDNINSSIDKRQKKGDGKFNWRYAVASVAAFCIAMLLILPILNDNSNDILGKNQQNEPKESENIPNEQNVPPITEPTLDSITISVVNNTSIYFSKMGLAINKNGEKIFVKDIEYHDIKDAIAPGSEVEFEFLNTDFPLNGEITIEGVIIEAKEYTDGSEPEEFTTRKVSIQLDEKGKYSLQLTGYSIDNLILIDESKGEAKDGVDSTNNEVEALIQKYIQYRKSHNWDDYVELFNYDSEGKEDLLSFLKDPKNQESKEGIHGIQEIKLVSMEVTSDPEFISKGDYVYDVLLYKKVHTESEFYLNGVTRHIFVINRTNEGLKIETVYFKGLEDTSRITTPFQIGAHLEELLEYYGDPAYIDSFLRGRLFMFRGGDGYILDEVENTVFGFYITNPDISIFGAKVGMTGEEIDAIFNQQGKSEHPLHHIYEMNGYRIYFESWEENGPTTYVVITENN